MQRHLMTTQVKYLPLCARSYGDRIVDFKCPMHQCSNEKGTSEFWTSVHVALGLVAPMYYYYQSNNINGAECVNMSFRWKFRVWGVRCNDWLEPFPPQPPHVLVEYNSDKGIIKRFHYDGMLGISHFALFFFLKFLSQTHNRNMLLINN